MPTRTSDAEWSGDLMSGTGKMIVGHGAYTGPFSFRSRMESGSGTNPEELLAAAHAGCFSMAFSAMLTAAGHKPERVHTTAAVTFEKVGDGFSITKIALTTEGKVPGIDAEKFAKIAREAKAGCPVSKALASVQEISLDAKLL
jgi:osmotically inducible protein OsmC